MAAQAVDQVGGSAFGDDLTVIDNGEAVTEAFGLVHVVSREQDGATFFLEGADDVPELAAALRIEAGGGLVKKEDARIADQSSGYGQALFLAAGKFADPGAGFLGKLKFFEDAGGGTGFAVEAGEQFDGFADGQFFRQARFLERDADPLAQLARVVVPGMTEDADFSGSGCEQALEDFDGGGLPCSVGTEQAEAFAGFDLQAEAADGFDFAVVGLAQVGTLDCCLCCRSHW